MVEDSLEVIFDERSPSDINILMHLREGRIDKVLRVRIYLI